MKNLNLFVFNQSWFHLGSLIENIVINFNKFDKVTFYFINKNLYVKPLDMSHSFFISNFIAQPPEEICKEFLKEFLNKNQIEFEFKRVELPRDAEFSNLDKIPTSFRQIQQQTYLGTGLGLAVSSFLITLTKDSQPKIKKYLKLIKNLIKTYIQVFAFLNTLKLDKKNDEVWICNGRPFHDRIIVEYCKKFDLKHKFYELGGESDLQERWILHDVSPHDRINHQIEIKEYNSKNKIEINKVENWFLRQKNGSENVFASKFKKNLNLKLPKNYFVYFSSSDDEVSAISLDWISSWGDQLNAVQNLIYFFENNPNFNIIIRVHPNQKNKSRSDRKKWKSLRSNSTNIKIYNFDSNINSYDLLEKSVGVITYGSTIGVEAAFSKKAAALLAHSRWDEIIPHKYLKEYSDLSDWICKVTTGQTNIKELDAAYKGSLMWANYMTSAGNAWNMIRLKKDFRGRNVGYIDSKCLKPFFLIIVLTRFNRFLRLHLIERKFVLG